MDAVLFPPTLSPETEGYAEYLKTLTIDVSHKIVTTRAEVGWICKTDLFISGVSGPRSRLISYLTRFSIRFYTDAGILTFTF
jgi:hypothetical protein